MACLDGVASVTVLERPSASAPWESAATGKLDLLADLKEGAVCGVGPRQSTPWAGAGDSGSPSILEGRPYSLNARRRLRADERATHAAWAHPQWGALLAVGTSYGRLLLLAPVLQLDGEAAEAAPRWRVFASLKTYHDRDELAACTCALALSGVSCVVSVPARSVWPPETRRWSPPCLESAHTPARAGTGRQVGWSCLQGPSGRASRPRLRQRARRRPRARDALPRARRRPHAAQLVARRYA